MVVNVGGLALPLAPGAPRTSRRRSPATPPTWGPTPCTSVGVLVGLVLVQITGADAIDSIVAIVVACVIVFAGLRILLRSGRVLLDESPPAEELDQIEAAIARARPPEMVGYHKLRARTAGRAPLHRPARPVPRRHHARAGPPLAHELRDAIEARAPQVEVLIHVEPEASSARDPRDRAGRSEQVDRRRRGRPRRRRCCSRCSRRSRAG